MSGRRKRVQREEVRYILHAMRLELAAHRLASEQTTRAVPVLPMRDVIWRARSGGLGV